MRSLALMGIFLLLSLPSVAAKFVETDTHFYMTKYNPHGVLEVERETGQERFIPISYCPSEVFCHRGQLYLTCFQVALYAFDPRTNAHKELYKFNSNDFLRLCFYEHYVILFKRYDSKNLNAVRLDLDNLNDERLFKIKHSVHRMTFDNTYLFASCQHPDAVDVYHKDTLEHVKTFCDFQHPMHMLSHKGLLYVTWGESARLTVYDTKSLEIKCTIPVGCLPSSMTVYKGFLYVKNSLHKTLSVVNLDNHEVVKTIKCRDDVHLKYSLLVSDDIGYLLTLFGRKIWIIDMIKQETITIKTLSTSSGLSPRFGLTDRAVYINGKFVMPLFFGSVPFEDLLLFAPGFEVDGVELYDDGEEAFQSLIREKDTAKAQIYLKYALKCANSKAYALASWAYLHGKWGAKPDLYLHLDYMKSADPTYYKKLASAVKNEESAVCVKQSKKEEDQSKKNDHDVYQEKREEDWEYTGLMAGISWGGF